MPDPRETTDHDPAVSAAESKPTGESQPTGATTVHAPKTPPAPRAGTTDPVSAGAYRIVRKLGEGAMGAVFLAEQASPQRLVALKVIRPDRVSPRLLMRFRLESQILAWLRHPAVAQVYESGEVDGPHGKQPYYAMEFVEGEQLDRYADGHDLDARGRMELLAAVCDGVEAAHRRGITHRDLKPANIFVTEDGQPKILDFGVARVSDPDAAPDADRTEQGQVIGTPNYMSPEQAAGDPAAIDTRADVYALGVIFYELLSGQLPINLKGKSLTAAVREIATAEPPPLSTLDGRFRGDVTAIAAKALAKDPRERYQSAADLAADVRRHLSDLPIQARPPGTLGAFRKFARRNKAVVAAAAFAVFALVTGAGAATYGMLEAKAETKRANGEADNARLAEGQEREARKAEEGANRAARAELVTRTFAVGRLQQRQGRYADALASFQKARELGYPDEVEYLLATLECRISLAQINEAKVVAAALSARTDLGRHKGEVLLRLAEAGFWLDQRYGAEPEELIRRASAAGLSPAREAYARALLATNIAEMERHLRESVRLDPVNPDGAAMLAVCQLLLGKFTDLRVTLGQMETVSPGSIGVRALEVALAMFEADAAARGRAEKRLAEVSPLQAEVLGKVGEAFSPLLTENFLWTMMDRQTLPRILGQILTLVPKIAATVGGSGSDFGSFLKFLNLPIARGIKVANVNQMFAEAMAGRDNGGEVFAGLVDKCPNGFAYLGRGIEKRGRKDYAGAIPDYRRALELPSPVPVRKPALAYLAEALFSVYRAPDKPFLEGPPAEELRRTLRELARYGPIPDDVMVENLVFFACLHGELASATAIGSALAARNSDSESVLRTRVLLYYYWHDFPAVLAAGARLQNKYPKGNELMETYVQSARTRLREQAAGQFGPPKDPVIPPAQP